MVARIVERVAGRYEVGETEFGRVYRGVSRARCSRVWLRREVGLYRLRDYLRVWCEPRGIIQEGVGTPSGWETKLSAPGGMLGITRVPGYLIERASATGSPRRLPGRGR